MSKSFAVIVTLGGRTKAVTESSAKNAYSKGQPFGLTEYYGPRNGGITGCKVWIYSRQNRREMADTFFHEMTHVFLQMIGGVKKQGADEEFAARWIGYLSKAMLADYDAKYGRNFKTPRRIIAAARRMEE